MLFILWILRSSQQFCCNPNNDFLQLLRVFIVCFKFQTTSTEPATCSLLYNNNQKNSRGFYQNKNQLLFYFSASRSRCFCFVRVAPNLQISLFDQSQLQIGPIFTGTRSTECALQKWDLLIRRHDWWICETNSNSIDLVAGLHKATNMKINHLKSAPSTLRSYLKCIHSST